MPAAKIPFNEQDRLRNLYSYELLDTLPEKDYDDITNLASFICDTPVSLVTIIDADRQWIKSAHGINMQQTSRDDAFCAHTILKPGEIMMVPNTRNDDRFVDNPFVSGENQIMFYAGIPLLTEEGYPIGSLCVIDNKPKELNETQQQALKMLANQTMRLIQLHKKTKELSRSRQLMLEINRELENFAQVTAENLKLPCDNAIEFTDLIAEKFADALDGDGKQLLSLIKYSCESVKETVNNTLEKANRISMLQDNKMLFTFSNLMQELKQHLHLSSVNITVGKQPENETIYSFKNILLQILSHIISGSSQFNDKQEQRVEISYAQTRNQYVFMLTDNGKGVPVFSRSGKFSLLQATDNNADSADYTINLNKVKELITSLSGMLEMRFEENTGTTFTIRLQK